MPENDPKIYDLLPRYKGTFANFSTPYDVLIGFAKEADQTVEEKYAFWNPVIGGEYLLYGMYMGSIHLGQVTVDALGQLRFTLHLYNALTQADSDGSRFGLDDVPLLRHLDKAFRTSKGIWVGGRPTKGSYEKIFRIAMGESTADAARQAEESKMRNLNIKINDEKVRHRTGTR